MDKSSLSPTQIEEIEKQKAERPPNRKERRAAMRANRGKEKLRQKQIIRSIQNNKLKGTPLMEGLIGIADPKPEEPAPQPEEKKTEIIGL